MVSVLVLSVAGLAVLIVGAELLVRGGGLPPEKWPSLKQAFEPWRMPILPQKKHKPEEVVAKLRQVDVLLSQGRPRNRSERSVWTPEVCEA